MPGGESRRKRGRFSRRAITASRSAGSVCGIADGRFFGPVWFPSALFGDGFRKKSQISRDCWSLFQWLKDLQNAPPVKDATTRRPAKDRKQRRKEQEKKKALGHKEDDAGSWDWEMRM